jgi:hypothetical protein
MKIKMHWIEVDDKVFKFLQKNAEPLIDTPSTVLYKLLFDEQHPDTSDNNQQLKFTGLPKGLSQILEVLFEISQNGLSRQQATRLVAEKHNTVPPTIMDKYCKQLELKAREVDSLLEEPGYEKFMKILMEKFPDYKTVIDLFFETLFVEA